MSHHRVNPSVRNKLRKAALGGIVTLGLGGTLLWCVYSALHSAPSFYDSAVAIPADIQRQAGDEMERGVLELHNDVQHAGRWQAIFTDEQINGWLATDLPEKFPELLPPMIRDPRVEIRPHQMQVACRYDGPKLSAVVSLLLEVHLADEPNTLAVRIRSARAGLVPLPLKNFLDQIAVAARQTGLTMRWAQDDGDPVALVTVDPNPSSAEPQQTVLDAIELRGGDVLLAGSTESQPGNESDGGQSLQHRETAEGQSAENRPVQR